MKFLEEICFYLTRSRNNIFVIVKTNVFGIDGGRLVLGLFHISSMLRLFSAETPPTFVLERLSLVKRALIANSVFFLNRVQKYLYK